MFKPINEKNHYWVVRDGPKGKVYSTNNDDRFVAENDEGYKAFLAAGNEPKSTTVAGLARVLGRLSLRPADTADNAALLDTFKDMKVENITIADVVEVLHNLMKRIAVLEGRDVPNTVEKFRAEVRELI